MAALWSQVPPFKWSPLSFCHCTIVECVPLSSCYSELLRKWSCRREWLQRSFALSHPASKSRMCTALLQLDESWVSSIVVNGKSMISKECSCRPPLCLLSWFIKLRREAALLPFLRLEIFASRLTPVLLVILTKYESQGLSVNGKSVALEAIFFGWCILLWFTWRPCCILHDRGFLNEVCTDTIEFDRADLYVAAYPWWVVCVTVPFPNHSFSFTTVYRGNYDSYVNTRDEKIVYHAYQGKRAHMTEFIETFRPMPREPPWSKVASKQALERHPVIALHSWCFSFFITILCIINNSAIIINASNPCVHACIKVGIGKRQVVLPTS